MERFFLQIVNMSITASWIILAVLVLRLLLRRAPKKYSYALWSVVAFRLCCPVSFKAAFSFLSLLNFGRKQPAAQMGVQPSGAMVYVPSDIGFAPQPEVHLGSEVISEAVTGSLPAATPMYSANPMQILLAIAAAVWCVGMAAMVIYSLVSWLLLKRRLRTATLLEGNLWQSERVGSPFILGIVRPKIYIPYHLDADTLRYVLDHERNHLKRGDHLIKLLGFLLLTVHWFNPLCWLAFWLMGKDMEMRCDEAVLEKDGGAKPYGTALLSFAANRRFPLAGPLAFGESGVKSRIQNILRWERPRVWITVLALVICLAALLACAANPKEQEETPMPETPEEMPGKPIEPEIVDGSYTIAIAGRNDLRFFAYGDALWTAFGADAMPWIESSEILVTDAIRPRLEAVFEGKTVQSAEGEAPANINVMEVSTGECLLRIDDSGFVTVDAGSFRGYFELTEAELDTLYALIEEGYGVDPNAMAPVDILQMQDMTVITYKTGVRAAGYSVENSNLPSREQRMSAEMLTWLHQQVSGKIPQKVEKAPGGITLMKFVCGDWSMTIRDNVAYVLDGTQSGTFYLSDAEWERFAQLAYESYTGRYEFGQYQVSTPEWNGAVDQYLQFMSEKLPPHDPSAREPYDDIDLADLDLNGVPELILYSYGAEVWDMTVCTIEDSTVCSLTPSEVTVKYDIPLSRNAVSERMYGVCPLQMTAQDWVERDRKTPNCYLLQYGNNFFDGGRFWMILSQKGHWLEGLSEWSEEYTAWEFFNHEGYLAAEPMFRWYREGNEDGPTYYETEQNTGLAAEVEILRWREDMSYRYMPVLDYPYGTAAKEYGLK